MANKNLKYFMREESRQEQIFQVPAPARFVDENGKVVQMEVKKLHNDTIAKINDMYKSRTPMKDKKGNYIVQNGEVVFKTEKDIAARVVWYGARALKEAPYVDEFRAIERDFPNFSFNLALDRPDPEADAAGEKYTPGFVHNVLYENYLKNHQAPEDCIYLMCGPPMMIASVVKMLDSLGVPSENILYDNFGS